MASVIINPFTPIPLSDRSHTRGYSLALSQRLNNCVIGSKNVNLNNYTKVYIDHGINFSGQLNLFGGLTSDVYQRLIALMKHKDVYSLEWDIDKCNYPEQLRKRLNSKTTYFKFTEEFIQEFETFLTSVQNIKMNSFYLNNAIIGDSHSIAYSKSDQAIFQKNGQTLFSILKEKTIKDYIMETTGNTKYITLCLGSIDIRFHVLNKDKDNKMSAKELAQEYCNQVIKAQSELGIKIIVCKPVPIEHEERKIPGTGKYKGKNFNGTREERIQANNDFIEVLDEHFFDFDTLSPPEKWYNMDGEEYARDIMEMSSSVHISPKNYNSVLGW